MRTRRKQAAQGNVLRRGKNWVGCIAVLLLGLVGSACAGAGRTIEETESLRVAAFWLVFIILSLMVEKMFHFSEHSLQAAGKKG
jgi:Ca2+/Na+ antiporter